MFEKPESRPSFEFLDDIAASVPMAGHLLLACIGAVIGFFVGPHIGHGTTHKIGAFLGFFVGFLSVPLTVKLIRYAWYALIIIAALWLLRWIFAP